MNEPPKPKAIEDIDVGFESIGDPGWEDAIRTRLRSYGVPLPQPMNDDEIGLIHKRVSRPFPEKLMKLYQLIGPLDLGHVRFLNAQEVELGTSVWFIDSLSEAERALLCDQLLLIDVGRSDNFISYDLASESCRYLCHDPASTPVAFASLDHLLHWAMAEVFVGHYGWPDDSVEQLVSVYRMQFTTVL